MNSIKKLITFPYQVVLLMYEAWHSPFSSFAERLETFRVLLSLSIRYNLQPTSKKPVTHRIFGYRVNASNYQTLLYLFREIFLSNDYQFTAKSDSPTIIDCGANIGMATLYFKRKYPHSTIIAFEPNPTAFHLLEKNIADNQLTNVQAVNIGLSDQEGSLSFYYDADNSLRGSIHKERSGGNGQIDIQVNKLSTYLAKHKPTLVKMDVEGAEFSILEDLIAQQAIPYAEQYIIEYHHKIQGERAKLSHFLQAFETAGFDYNLHTQMPEKAWGFQDVLIHFCK